MGAPATLPADFFERHAKAPATLPADFFSRTTITPETLQSFIVRRSQGQLSPEEDAELVRYIGDPANKQAVEAAKAGMQTDYVKEVNPVSRALMPAADAAVGTVELGKRAAAGGPVEQALLGPLSAGGRALKEIGSGAFNAQLEAVQEFKEKPGFRTFMEAATPVIGPMNRSIRKKVEAGDVAGAAGETLLDVAGARGATKPPVPGAKASAFTRTLGTAVREKLPQMAVRDVIGPHLSDFKFGRNPVKAVVEEGISAATNEGMLKKISARKSELGKRIDMQLSLKAAAGKVVDVKKAVTDSLFEHMRLARQLGDDALTRRLVKFRNAVTKRTSMSPREAAKLKRDIGDSVHWTEDPVEASLNAAKQDVYRALNDAVDQQVPGTKELNARFADLLHAEKSMKRVVDKGQGLKGWIRKGTVGGLGAAGGGPVGAVAAMAADSTAGRTMMAKAISRKYSPQVKPLPPQSTGSKVGQLVTDADGFRWEWTKGGWKLFSRPRP